MKALNIYVVPQYYGWGPISNMFTVLQGFRALVSSKYSAVNISAKRHGGTELFSKNHPGVIDRLCDSMDESGADLIVSFFDADTVVEAWAKKKPVICFLNMV